MARFSGKNTKISVDSDGGGAPAELIGNTGWSLDTKGDVVDVSGTDSAGNEEYIAGFAGWSGSADGHFDTDEADILATAGPVAPLVSVGNRIELELYTLGTDTAAKYSGDAIVTGFSVKVDIKGSVDWSLTFQGTGTLAYPTIT